MNNISGPAKQKGLMILYLLFFIAFLVAIGVSVISETYMANKMSNHNEKRELAFQIAEAGIEYYRWHLAHAPTDYKDGHSGDAVNGNGNYGPYTHDYYDADGNKLGSFVLEITPPQSGSTIVIVKSKGVGISSPNTKRSITVRVGRRSLTEYSFLSYTPIWIGAGENISGPLHSNGGIRFDGTTNAKVTSAKATYDCTGLGQGCSGIKPGIWGIGGPQSYWQFPVSAIDFTGITMDFANMKAAAQSAGLYLPSQGNGYRVVFKNTGLFDVYKVTSVGPQIKRINDDFTGWVNVKEQISAQSLYLSNQAIPSNQLIFAEDNVWVEGTVKGRVTLAAAKLPDNPSQYKDITINGNINYVARDGTNSLGLMAQGNIVVPRYAPPNLTITASLLAQNKHVWRPEYYNPVVDTSIEVYGGVVTNQFWTWSYVSGNTVVDGYQTTRTIYNNNLTFSPPPFFPTTGSYEILSWQES